MKSPYACALALFLVAWPLGAPAQPRETAWRDRARTFLVLRIAEALKLSDQDALKLSGVIRQSDDRRQELLRQRTAVEDRLRGALDKQPSDDAALSKAIADGNDIDQKLALVPEDTFRELQKFLTVAQQARLVLLRRELQAEIRNAIEGRRMGGGPRALGRGGRLGAPGTDE